MLELTTGNGYCLVETTGQMRVVSLLRSVAVNGCQEDLSRTQRFSLYRPILGCQACGALARMCIDLVAPIVFTATVDRNDQSLVAE
jgi:hypothetical protein